MYTCVLSHFSCVQLFLTLSSSPCSSVYEILQARILEWVVISSSRGSSPPRAQTCISCASSIAGRFFTTEPPGKPIASISTPPTYAHKNIFSLLKFPSHPLSPDRHFHMAIFCPLTGPTLRAHIHLSCSSRHSQSPVSTIPR